MAKMKTPKDTRELTWQELETEIQWRAKKKDKRFRLSGPWKKLVRVQDGFKVYAVNGKWVQANLSVIFGTGGNGLVHEFIPADEVWINTHHYRDTPFNTCACKNVKDERPVSRAFFDSTALHEITECKAMKKGMPYWQAHHLADEAELRAGILKDPYLEVE